MKRFLIRLGNYLVEGLTLGGLMASVLYFGGVGATGEAVTFLPLAGAFGLWIVLRLMVGEEPSETRNHGPFDYRSAPALRLASPLIAPLLLLLIGYLLVQVTPLPAGVVAVLSPQRVADENVLRAALGAGPLAWTTLSVDPAASQESMLILAGGLMALLIGAYLAGNRQRIRRLMAALLIFILLEAFYGLAEQLTGHQAIWGVPAGPFACGTFINRNHFAALLVLFLPLSVGWLLHRAAMMPPPAQPLQPSGGIFMRRQGLWLLVPIVLLVGIIQSASRGGFAGMLIGLALFFALGLKNRFIRALSWISVVIGLTCVLYAANSDYEVVFRRFAELEHSNDRTVIWRDSLGILRDYPLFGIGLGGFPRVFMQYSTESTAYYPFKAHNEWLEGFLTLGVIGMGLTLPLVLTLFGATLKQVRRARRDQPWLLGAWCGLVGLAAHCVMEFNLHLPALLMLTFFLLGVLLRFNVVGSRSPDEDRDGTRRRDRRHRRSIVVSEMIDDIDDDEADCSQVDEVEAGPVQADEGAADEPPMRIGLRRKNESGGDPEA